MKKRKKTVSTQFSGVKMKEYKKALVDEEKLMQSDKMKVANEVWTNLIIIDNWGEEAEKHPGYKNMSEHADWQKRIIKERQKEFKKNREQLELDEGILRRYMETEDCFFV
jgi:hypothetical protein